jgi:hypothetical protein
MNLEEALLRADEPRRPLDWRFRRASVLSRYACKIRRPHRRLTDDQMVSDYADMLYRLNKHETYFDLEKIRRRHPDWFRVHLAYATLNATELALLDALLLCRSVDPAIVFQQTGMNEQQQQLYRQMFLDVMDRRQMTAFIASQIMEPSKLRPSCAERKEYEDIESPVEQNRAEVYGTFSEKALRVLRLVGFYSSPIVVELMYSGFVADAMPEGRDSAMKYMTQAYLTKVRCRGFMSSCLESYSDSGIEHFMKLAYALALEEREEGQFDLMQNIEKWWARSHAKIADPSTMAGTGSVPQAAFTGAYELSESELALAAQTGQLPEELTSNPQLVS